MPESGINKHSEEVQDLMGRIPGWTVRWGLLVIAIVFIGIFTAGYLIRYPHIISAPVQLTSYNPPVDMMARVSGRVSRLFVTDGDSVRGNTPILLLENTTDYQDLIYIDRHFVDTDADWNDLVFNDTLYANYRLGNIQAFFLQYQKMCGTFKNYLQTSLLVRKGELLQNQIVTQTELLEQQREQLRLLQQDYDLSIKDFGRDSTMFIHKGIAEAEYERSKQGLLQKRLSFMSAKSGINTIGAAILALEENLIENNIQIETDLHNYYMGINELCQQLRVQIDNWKNDYLIVAPVDGKVFLSELWSENQNITGGERVATIMPHDSTMILGRAFLPFSGYAKVEKGQKVMIKLDSYPFMEYGHFSGEVKFISPVPGKEGYAVEIIFTNGMKSSYGMELKYIYQMTGTVDIITKDSRLIERFLQPMKVVWDKIEF